MIEIICTLLMLGLLMGIASPYFFDLRDEAEKKLAIATVDAAQVKINSRFQRLVTQGAHCEAALSEVNTLAQLADDGVNQFGEFQLSLVDNEKIVSQGVSVSARSIRSGLMYSSIATLSTPVCFGVDTSDGGSDESNEPTQPGNPNEDINIDGFPVFEDLQSHGGEHGVKPDKGVLFTNSHPPKKLYVIVHGQGNYGQGQTIEKLEENGTIVQVNVESYAQYDNGSWNPPVKNGTLVKVGDEIYVYVGEKHELEAPNDLLPPTQAKDPWYPVPKQAK